MKKKSVLIFLFLFTHIYLTYAQQVITDSTEQPNELIQNLVGDSCSSASNISSNTNGSVNNIISYGSFDRGTSNFPLQSGIVLSTGAVNSAGNTFIGQDLSEGDIDWVTDSDIEDILGIDQTLNATSIEFDFVSVNNFVAFKYLFASDEYQQEYPCNFKDVFAILIKRANSTDPYVNIALVPGTTSEVSTNTIHPNISGFCEAQNEDFFQGYNLGHTNFNGNTEVLTATSAIIPNETYHIKFLIADHIDERFDSAVFIEAEGFGNSIDLGPDQSVCGSDLTLDANINNAAAVYTWFLNGGIINGENSEALEAYNSGTYSVEVLIPGNNNNCILSDTIEIEIIPFQQAAPIDDFSICDAIPSDGLYDFDFTLKNDEIYSNLPSTNYTISYHFSLEDAQNNANPILGIYQNTEETETIFVRIESLAGDCLQIGNFDINVYSSPNTSEISLYVCNDDIFADFSIYGLSSLDFPVSNYEFNTTVTYYLTEEDAINAENPISDFPSVSANPESFFARVEDNFNGCPSIVPIYFDYLEGPDIGVDKFIFYDCLDPDYFERDGATIYNYDTVSIPFNIDDIVSIIENDYPGISVQVPILIIGVPRIFNVSGPFATLPLLLRFEGENCPTPISLELHKNVAYNILGREKTIYRCDDPSNDGVLDFDLVEVANELIEGYDITIEFYETEEDQLNGTNPLDQNIPLSVVNSQTLYITSTYEDCSHLSQLNLIINPALNVPPKTIDYCGNTDPNSNVTSISLTPLIDVVLEGLNIVGPVKFYLSEDDAENQENDLTENVDIESNQQLFYVRVTNFFTGCYDITTLQVNITNAIEATNPEPILVCDDDQDGIATVNLETVIPELSGNSDNLSFSFFESYQDAVDDQSPILNPTSYTTSSKELFIRGEIESLECFTVFSFEVLIYANPQLNDISDFISCEIDTSNPAGFFFVNKDSEILNGQTGMKVLYFETTEDALNRTNEIDKTSEYQNTTNPQTIYVRLENEAENACYKIGAMQIEVKQAPIFNQPSDVFECDINGTGLVSIDLNDKINEITQNTTQDLNITFHLTPLNADIGSNQLPLNYTSISNPQLIYARVEHIDSACFEVSPFYINALSPPQVNYGKFLINCGNNYDFSPEWNLTDIELEILEGRQYSIDFTYFESEEDVAANSNPIANPESFNNTSNPQTIYLKVENTITGCYASVPFELILNSPPIINGFETYNICANAESFVDLSEINEVLLDNTFNVLVSYYANQADAEANENPLNTNYNYTNTSEVLFASVEYSTTNCYAVYPFELVVNPLPIANQPNDLIACDDDFDGAVSFDLTQQNSAILNGQNPQDFTVSYFDSQINAIENIQAITSEYLALNGDIINARVENNSTGCYDITQFAIVVNPLPEIFIADQVICLDNLPLIVSADTNNVTDTFLWSTGETSSEVEIFETGSYAVTITNAFGCESTSTFNVTESESASIDFVETIDFSDPNNITVTINGIGDYLYQLNNLSFQTSNIFENVPIGYNTITIIDQNGCAQVTRDVLVIDAPKHMTPNDDGDFDTWHIAGVETLPGTTIQIFDRFGKLLKKLDANSLGWDGTYNGNKMPAGDYWFVANVIKNGKTFEVKGHFALRR